MLVAMRTGLPDIHMAIEDILAEGDTFMVRNTGRHRQGAFNGIEPTCNRVEIGGIVIGRVRDGKIVERWATIDTLTLMRQFCVIGAKGKPSASLTPQALGLGSPGVTLSAAPADGKRAGHRQAR